jgi:hypothetical protein
MKLFIDTGAFVAKHNKKDVNHEKATNTFQEILKGEAGVTRMYTSDYIVDEAVTVALARTRSHKDAVEVGEAIINSKAVEILKVDEDIFQKAWKIFKDYEEGFSFTDCTSFALMKNYEINHVFTFDDHFDILGFRRIP